MKIFFTSLLTIGFAFSATAAAQNPELRQLLATKTVLTDSVNSVVYLPGTFHPDAYFGWFTHTKHYHAVVWDGGGASSASPFTTPVNDSTFYAALVKIGAIPGNNLRDEAWSQRKNRNHPAPDTRVQGSAIKLSVWWPALEKPLPVDSLFFDPGGQGIDLRFGGNLSLISKWHSGCIVCLYSCPGGKVSNNAYTIRDYVDNKTKFEIKKSIAPAKESPVVLIFKLRK